MSEPEFKDPYLGYASSETIRDDSSSMEHFPSIETEEIEDYGALVNSEEQMDQIGKDLLIPRGRYLSDPGTLQLTIDRKNDQKRLVGRGFVQVMVGDRSRGVRFRLSPEPRKTEAGRWDGPTQLYRSMFQAAKTADVPSGTFKDVLDFVQSYPLEFTVIVLEGRDGFEPSNYVTAVRNPKTVIPV